jgi:biopolymer transport protein ExbD
MKFQPRRSEEPELNMTSLIDVVLLLLIFFMMSTRFIDESRLTIRLPEAGIEPQSPEVRDAVEVEVTARRLPRQRQALVNNSPDTLSVAVGRASSGNRAVPITIRADAARCTSLS